MRTENLQTETDGDGLGLKSCIKYQKKDKRTNKSYFT